MMYCYEFFILPIVCLFSDVRKGFNGDSIDAGGSRAKITRVLHATASDEDDAATVRFGGTSTIFKVIKNHFVN